MESLLDFLKKYSDVDVNFIKDFIEIREGDKTQYPFKIDLDIMSKWLKIRKGHLKETLINSYSENIDFIILSNDKNKHGGHNKEIILLTEDCFKMMCMRSKTRDADKIRYYYVTLEKLIEIYKDDIINNQQEKIEKLERNLKTYRFPVRGIMYVIKLDDGYRTGITNDMNIRYNGYKTHNKDKPPIEYIFYTDDINKLERCVRNLLKDEEYTNRKDFYMLDLADIITGIKDCDRLIKGFKCNSCKKKDNIVNFKNHVEDHINYDNYKDDKIKLRISKKLM